VREDSTASTAIGQAQSKVSQAVFEKLTLADALVNFANEFEAFQEDPEREDELLAALSYVRDRSMLVHELQDELDFLVMLAGQVDAARVVAFTPNARTFATHAGKLVGAPYRPMHLNIDAYDWTTRSPQYFDREILTAVNTWRQALVAFHPAYAQVVMRDSYHQLRNSEIPELRAETDALYKASLELERVLRRTLGVPEETNASEWLVHEQRLDYPLFNYLGRFFFINNLTEEVANAFIEERTDAALFHFYQYGKELINLTDDPQVFLKTWMEYLIPEVFTSRPILHFPMDYRYPSHALVISALARDIPASSLPAPVSSVWNPTINPEFRAPGLAFIEHLDLPKPFEEAAASGLAGVGYVYVNVPPLLFYPDFSPFWVIRNRQTDTCGRTGVESFHAYRYDKYSKTHHQLDIVLNAYVSTPRPASLRYRVSRTADLKTPSFDLTQTNISASNLNEHAFVLQGDTFTGIRGFTFDHFPFSGVDSVSGQQVSISLTSRVAIPRPHGG